MDLRRQSTVRKLSSGARMQRNMQAGNGSIGELLYKLVCTLYIFLDGQISKLQYPFC
jgi:hypothetical protein